MNNLKSGAFRCSCLEGIYLSSLLSLNQANKILMEKIEDDQFLNLMTVKTEVHSVCKEPYRSDHESYFHLLVCLVAFLSYFCKSIILVMPDVIICFKLASFISIICDQVAD